MSYLRSCIGTPLLLAFMIPAGKADADVAKEMASPASPSSFLGEWELDLARMPDTYGAPPKRVVYKFRDVGADQWLMTIDVTAPDGSVRHMAIRYRRDGRAARGEGELSEGDSAAINSPAPNILVMNIAKDKRPASVRVYAVSADGAEMTESAADIDDAGAPFVRNFHYTRVH